MLVCFSGGPDPRSARAGAVETQFFISGKASKKVRFSKACLAYMAFKFDKNRIKSDLEHNNPESFSFVENSVSFWAHLATL